MKLVIYEIFIESNDMGYLISLWGILLIYNVYVELLLFMNLKISFFLKFVFGVLWLWVVYINLMSERNFVCIKRNKVIVFFNFLGFLLIK